MTAFRKLLAVVATGLVLAGTANACKPKPYCYVNGVSRVVRPQQTPTAPLPTPLRPQTLPPPIAGISDEADWDLPSDKAQRVVFKRDMRTGKLVPVVFRGR